MVREKGARLKACPGFSESFDVGETRPHPPPQASSNKPIKMPFGNAPAKQGAKMQDPAKRQ